MSSGTPTRRRAVIRRLVGGLCVCLVGAWATILAGSLLELRAMLAKPADIRRATDPWRPPAAEAFGARPLAAAGPEEPLRSDRDDDSQASALEIEDESARATEFDEPPAMFEGFGSDDRDAQREAAGVFAERLTEFAERIRTRQRTHR